MKRVLTIALICGHSCWSWASGNRVGNGGDVIQCKQSIQLLDFYETHLPLKDFKSASTYKEVAKAVLNDLEKLNVQQGRQYKKRLESIENEIEFRPGIELKDVKDSQHLFKAKDKSCKMRQIALRRHETFGETKRFIIDIDLWKNLDETNKAGLLLHEIVYEHFYKLGEEDSQKARNFNAYLFSIRVTTASQSDYWEYIKSLKIPLYK